MQKANRESKIELNFYDELPSSKFNYNNFTALLDMRLDILRSVEAGIFKYEYSQITDSRKDLKSHFICRLVCSQIYWVSNWFITQETRLFKLKLMSQRSNNFNLNMYDCKIVDGVLVVGPYDKLETTNVTCDMPIDVHFSRISDLLVSREVVFKDGYARLSQEHLLDLLVNEFRFHLELKVKKLRNIIKNTDDQRYFRICNQHFSQHDHKGDMASAKIDESQKYFPPCISHIINTLNTKKHLKFNDRQALCRFFNSINIPVEDTIEFFRSKFDVPRNVFDKEYLYSIRHNYGLEGKKANYMSYTCNKIINMANSFGKSGCPFVSEEEYLKNTYKENLDIEDLAKNIKPEIKCKNLLEKLTSSKYEKAINTPVNFYLTYKKYDTKET